MRSCAQRLNGSANEKYGLAKSLSVMPGDKINVEVYAKYVDPNSTNWTGVLPTLMSQIAANTAGVVIDGAGYGTSTSTFPFPTQATTNTSGSSEPGPKAYLNWLVFNKDYQLLTGGFDRISTNAREFGQDVAHERLFSPEVLITEPGYVYIFLSNEESTPIEVYFDDLKVDHIKSPVIQTDDYYAFGLTYNSYSRENSIAQDYLYNGKEKQDELGLGWFDYGARMYMPDVGRWGVIDGKAEKYYPTSPYTYALNNPIYFIDPDGNEIVPHTASNFNGPAPKNIHDLGKTGTNSLNFAYNNKTKEFDLHVNIGITYTKEFQPRSVSRYDNVMEKDNGNPGLTDEVRNHEEGHRDQIVEAAKMDISVTVNGKEYSGSADKVFTNVVTDVTKNTNAKIDGLKSDLANGKISQKEFDSKVKSVTNAAQTSITNAGNSILGSVGENINNTMKGSNIENDANNRAAKRAPLQYANRKRPIMYNGKQLPE